MPPIYDTALNINPLNDPKNRPDQYVYCRTRTYTDHTAVEVTLDTETWDRWVDRLPADHADPAVIEVRLYGALIQWGADQAPPITRILERHGRIPPHGRPTED